MARTHCGELTPESKEEMLQSGSFYKARLKCICGATVTGRLDMNKLPKPLDHTIARMPRKTAKRFMLNEQQTA
jgi:hypothetical protein